MSIISEEIKGKIINVTIKSSNTQFASYNTETEVLTLTFNNGSKYEYYDVPWKVFTKFRSAPSQGKYFTTDIKTKYKYKQV